MSKLESLGAVHTHTHTHNMFLPKEMLETKYNNR